MCAGCFSEIQSLTAVLPCCDTSLPRCCCVPHHWKAGCAGRRGGGRHVWARNQSHRLHLFVFSVDTRRRQRQILKSAPSPLISALFLLFFSSLFFPCLCVCKHAQTEHLLKIKAEFETVPNGGLQVGPAGVFRCIILSLNMCHVQSSPDTTRFLSR